MMGFVLQNGASSLGTACNSGHLDVVKTLIEAGANINQAVKVSIYTATVNEIIACDQPSNTPSWEWCVMVGVIVCFIAYFLSKNDITAHTQH